MSKVIASVEKIEKFLRAVPQVLVEATAQADADGTYFTADCRVLYKQTFDVDTDKQVGGEVGATELVSGLVDAGVSGGIKIDKSKDGEIVIDETFKFRSKAALEVENA